MAYSTVSKPSLHFNTKLYTGDGNNSKAITGVGFQPDWVWLKRRDSAASHNVTDSVRGVNKTIYPNDTSAELTNDTYGYVSAFQSDGFTIGINGNAAAINANGSSMVSWNWKANGAGSTNYDGSITSTVSANTTAGFSIVSYTGTGSNATVGHGLGSAPKVVIVKQRTTSGYNWVYGGGNLTSWAYILKLNLTHAEFGDAGPQTCFNSTAPTSSVFSVGTSAATNNNTDNFIAYCFAEKKGYSKFGSYTGNGNADGTFIYTGFKPALIIFKRTDATKNWGIFDNKRDVDNTIEKILYPDQNFAESTYSGADFLSNGIKIRNSDVFNNGSGATYIYMAFAKEPLVANVGQGIPGTAR